MDDNKELLEMERLFDRLYPICRSITGEGLRQSLDILGEYIPLEREKFFTGEKVLNWSIPKEWVIREAWIKDEKGKAVLDFKDHNLHVVSYSIPVNKEVDLEELKAHLYTVPDMKNAIPYVTSYYDQRWGFCMTHAKYETLKEGKYRVYIDSDLVDGQLDLGQALIPGESTKEVFLSAYLCHPSMANNELSGPIVLAMLYNRILKWKKRNLSYRFVVNPETIGSIAYLSRYGDMLKLRMHTGMVLTCLGGTSCLRYKMSRMYWSPLDDVVRHLQSKNIVPFTTLGFSPVNGSDERQYCSPGFNLPVGQMARLVYGSYPEYHTSLDTKELMGIENLQNSVNEIEKVLLAVDYDGYYINTHPYGEVKLSDYDLYPKINSPNTRSVSTERISDGRDLLNSVLVILNYSDGYYKLTQIADLLGKSVLDLIPVVELLKEKKLLEGPYFTKGERTV